MQLRPYLAPWNLPQSITNITPRPHWPPETNFGLAQDSRKTKLKSQMAGAQDGKHRHTPKTFIFIRNSFILVSVITHYGNRWWLGVGGYKFNKLPEYCLFLLLPYRMLSSPGCDQQCVTGLWRVRHFRSSRCLSKVMRWRAATMSTAVRVLHSPACCSSLAFKSLNVALIELGGKSELIFLFIIFFIFFYCRHFF